MSFFSSLLLYSYLVFFLSFFQIYCFLFSFFCCNFSPLCFFILTFFSISMVLKSSQPDQEDNDLIDMKHTGYSSYSLCQINTLGFQKKINSIKKQVIVFLSWLRTFQHHLIYYKILCHIFSKNVIYSNM